MIIKKLFLLLLVVLAPLVQAQRPLPPPSEKPKNIILMIGDGMGISQITAGLIANGNRLNLERFRHIGLIRTFAADKLITDSAAGATAFSSGQKTNVGYVGLNPSRKSLPTIMEIAHQNRMGTGLVVTSYVQHATPAAFFAHVPNRYYYEDITLDFLNETVDVAIGGGREYFEKRKDGKVISDSLQKRGYELFDGLRQAQRKSTGDRVFVLANKGHLPAMHAGRGKFLPKATAFAIEKLNKRPEGFFMLVEGSQIDFGGHANDKDYIINEVLDFDRTIEEVLNFAEQDGNTLVIVTADHETGGFSVEDGEISDFEVVGDFTTGLHTAALIPVFAFGPGAEAFGGMYPPPPPIFKMMDALGLEVK
jgi:alkaline phosphatase